MVAQERPFFIVIFGPTGVGKTEFSLELAHHLPAEIINADMGQLYEPLSIGTAKPAWRDQSVKHHLFDIINEPRDYSAYTYRQECLKLLPVIAARGKIPVIVGGTGFYLQSLFFTPSVPTTDEHCVDDKELVLTWDFLFSIDPERAVSIHPHDRYRIERALRIWQKNNTLPSSCKPQLQLPGPCLFVFLDRQKEELVASINRRVEQMINNGWVEEVKALSAPWHTFLLKKRLIGYPELIEYVEHTTRVKSLTDTIAAIQKRTRDYSRRQRTFWRGLKKSLSAAHGLVSCEEIDVRSQSMSEVAKQLCHALGRDDVLSKAALQQER